MWITLKDRNELHDVGIDPEWPEPKSSWVTAA